MSAPGVLGTQTARTPGELWEALGKLEIDLLRHACRVQPASGDVDRLGLFDYRSNSVIGRQRNPNILLTQLLLEEGKEIGELSIKRYRHRSHFGTIRPDAVTKNVIR